MKKLFSLLSIFLIVFTQFSFATDINNESNLDSYVNQIANIVFEELENNEILKAWWESNYNLAKKLYQSNEYQKKSNFTLKEEWNIFSGDSPDDHSIQISKIRQAIREKIEAIEIEKAGWKDNYALIKKILYSSKYSTTQKAAIDKAMSDLLINKELEINNDTGNKLVDIESIYKTLNYSDWKTLKQWTNFFGSTKSKISILVFFDFECPACKRLNNNKIIENVQKKYWKTVNYAFKHFPLKESYIYSNSWALAAECVREQLGKAWFQNYINNLMNIEKIEAKDIKDSAYKLRISKEKFDQCYDTAKYQTKIDQNEQQWIDIFGVDSVPAAVIINTNTLKWTMLNWWYPQENFEKIIQELLK